MKEIVMVALVVLALFMLPRFMRRGASGGATRRGGESAGRNTGLLRLAVLISGLWVAAVFLLFNPLRGEGARFFAVGILPVVAGWGTRWVSRGFRGKS